MSEAAVRDETVVKLMEEGGIRTPLVEQAFRAVKRTSFTCDGSLEDAYGGGVAVTERDELGNPVSTMSAPWLQAAMLERSGVAAGMHVVEVGSGGCNAAMISSMVGPTGSVTSIDIRVSVIERARAGLADQEFDTSNVELQTDDAWATALEVDHPVDAVIVTVDVWDIPWNLVARLRVGGVLVAPMNFAGMGCCLVVRKSAEGSLTGHSPFTAGFVAGAGSGTAVAEYELWSHDSSMALTSSARLSSDKTPLDRVLDLGPYELPTGVQTHRGAPLLVVFLWLLTGYERVAMWGTSSGRRVAGFTGANPQGTPVWCRSDGSFATVGVVPAGEGDGFEYVVRGYGSSPRPLMEAMRERLVAWGQKTDAEHVPQVVLRARSSVPGDEHSARNPHSVFDRPTTDIDIVWRR